MPSADPNATVSIFRLSAGAAVAALLLSGCPDSDEAPPGATETASTDVASVGASTSTPGSSSTGDDASTSEIPPSSSGASSSGNSVDTGMITTAPFPDFPPPEPRYCGLEDIDPTTDPTLVVDAGDAAGQLPPAVGDALVRNCGCHYTDNVDGFVDYMSDGIPIATHADFHVPFTGVFPQNFDGLVYEAVERRVVFSDPLPMPSIECDVVGEDGTITDADLALFTDWLAAGAPDAPNYPIK